MLFDFQTRVDQFAQVPSTIFPGAAPNDYAGNRDAAIAEAVREYSTRRPRNLVTVATPMGAGTFEYLLPPGTPITAQGGTAGCLNISGWNEDQYFIERIVFPYGKFFGYQRMEVDWKWWSVYKKEDNRQYLQFWDMVPSANMQMGIYYIAPHVVADLVATSSPAAGSNVSLTLPSTAGLNGGLLVSVHDTSHTETAQIVPISLLATTITATTIILTTLAYSYTTPTVRVDTIKAEHPQDVDAVAHLATSILLGQLANLYSDKQRSTIKADTVQYGDKSKHYSERAQAERDMYTAAMARVPQVNGATMQWQTSATGGGDRLVHRKNWS